jgi:hypothetical protein
MKKSKSFVLVSQGHMIRGGNGSHWVGCEETHFDCAEKSKMEVIEKKYKCVVCFDTLEMYDPEEGDAVDCPVCKGNDDYAITPLADGNVLIEKLA